MPEGRFQIRSSKIAADDGAGGLKHCKKLMSEAMASCWARRRRREALRTAICAAGQESAKAVARAGGGGRLAGSRARRPEGCFAPGVGAGAGTDWLPHDSGRPCRRHIAGIRLAAPAPALSPAT